MFKGLAKLKSISTRFKKQLQSNAKFIITGVNTSEKVVSLTFDDGPHPEYTPPILDLLDKYNAKATFFVIGESVENYPSIYRRIIESGHAVGNHTWSHIAMPMESRITRIKELRKTQQLLEKKNSRLFRPPFGFLNIASYIDVKLMGLTVLNWNIDAMDWNGPSVETLYDRLNSNIQPGGIVLMHDNLHYALKPEYKSRNNLMTALEKLLIKYTPAYSFITVPELLKKGEPRYSYGLTKKSERNPVIPN